MRVLLVNIPNTKRDASGQVVAVGPNAGSRWPFLGIRPGSYAPYPTYLGYATSYLREFGIDAHMLDCVAEGRWHPSQWNMSEFNAEIVVYEISAPVEADVLACARASKAAERKVVLCGPHCASAGEQLAALDYVDHVIIGEYELPLLAYCDDPHGKVVSRYDHVDDLNTANGKPWHPYRIPATLAAYYDPSMATERTQLTICTSRGCAWHCNYCQWQKVLNNKSYRTRSVDAVEAEIRAAMELGEVKSLFFDDDTWNLGGERRVGAMCDMLKRFGLPWSMMGRLDAHPLPLFDRMVDAGCVGMRFGVESFTQHVLDRTGGRRDANRQYQALHHILSKFKGVEIHCTSMRDMPGQTDKDWKYDTGLFNALKSIAEENGNRFHWQVSRATPFPGTDLEEQMRAAGHGELIDAAGDFNGAGQRETPLNKAVREFVPVTIGGK